MTTLDPGDLRRMGALFAHRPERILQIVEQWQQQDRTIESRVLGSSMAPTLPDGAQIRIRLCRQDHARGAVIAFLIGSRVTVHRVLRRAGPAARRLLVTCGDARAFPDPPVEPTHVLGVVTEVCVDGSWCAPADAPRRRGLRRVACGALVVLFAIASFAGHAVAQATARAAYRLLHWRRDPGDVTAPAATTGTRAPTSRVRSD